MLRAFFFVSLGFFYKSDPAVKLWIGLAVAAFISIRIAVLWARRKGFTEVPSIPRVQGKLPGNIDVLWQLVYNDGREYCGETLRMWAEMYGPTYDMNILWGNQVQQLFLYNVMSR